MSFISADKIEPVFKELWLVKNLIPEKATTVVFGESGAGKSFWVLDLASHIVSGRSYNGLSVAQGTVAYILLEGGSGGIKRVTALKQEKVLSEPSSLLMDFDPTHLFDEDSVEKHLSELRGIADLKLLVVDTLSKAIAGQNENDNAVMSRVHAVCDRLRKELECAVLLVHHTGKATERGARGGYALYCGTDAEIEIKKSRTQFEVHVGKQRDEAKAGPSRFRLRTVVLGQDEDGEDVTSCVVEHLGAPQAAKKGRRPKASSEDLLSLLPQESVRKWKEAAEKKFDIKRSAFGEYKKQLTDNHQAKETDEGQWIAAQ